MGKSVKSLAHQLAEKLRTDLQKVFEDARQLELNPRSRSLISEEVQRSAVALNALLAELDPVERPRAIFDPGNPRTVGFFVALALTAQPRKPLAELSSFYGAGVYALYYKGAFDLYRQITSTETPIYVGMAIYGARDGSPLGLGQSLAGRLLEHKKNIQKASDTLDIADFEYRALVVQSGWEGPAEDYLIRMFRPLWNREVKIVYGFGKHGDSSETRKNKRSPWDTLHSGRKWAGGEDAKSLDQIARQIERHFDKTKVYADFQEIFSAFVAELSQNAI